MPFLKQIVEIVNSDLRERSLKDKRFQSGKYDGIAVDVSRPLESGGAQTFPAVLDANYEAQPVTPDDTYPITIYHKVVSKRAKNPQGSGNYGDGNGVRGEVVDMKMVVFGKYAALKLTAEQLEALITINFPDVIAKAKTQPLKLDSVLIEYQSTNMNSVAVFQEEYKGFELFLAPEDIMFSIRYSIESKFRKGCFTICDCESSVS